MDNGIREDKHRRDKVSFTYYKLRLWFLDTSLQVSITSYIRGEKKEVRD